MNLNRLKQAEDEFLAHYPGGFSHPDMMALGKKHKMDRMIELSQQAFDEVAFAHPNGIIENLIKIISRSSMVSMFEKPKFKGFANNLDRLEKDLLVEGLQERLYGNEQHGFEMMLELLNTRKIGKWTLVSICPVYFRPQFEVFVKPTTVKKIISQLCLKNLEYRPTPDWEFYRIFRDQINILKSKVDPGLSPSNAAFTGFLMMSL